MSISVKSLRVWLLVGAGLLLVVIGGFLGYAHYRAHRFLAGLPGKLGVNIQREADGYTWSQSVKGRTVFTMHAAKAIQRTDGKTTLRDVGIILYGNGQGSSQRVDRIYGKEFEYDENAEIIRAMGEVHIDLQAPKPADAHATMEEHDAKTGGVEDERLIHVKTSGLVFLKKLGVAATDQQVEFEFHGMTGHALGAEYNSDSGVLVLQSGVKVNGLQQGEPVVLTAGRAEMHRQSDEVLLSHAKYQMVGGLGGGRTAEAEKSTVHLRGDGSVELVQAEGDVRLGMANGTDAADGTWLTGARGEARVSAGNQLESAVLLGAVRLVSDGPLRQARGEAEEAKAGFDKAGRVQRVVMGGGTHLHERVRATDSATAPWSERDLAARSVDLGLFTDEARRVQLRTAKAEGEARLVVMNPPVAGAKSGHTGATSSALAGDVLTADFVTQAGTSQVKSVHGAGHTALKRVSDTGSIETSTGDELDAEFRLHGGRFAGGASSGTKVAVGGVKGNGTGGLGQAAEEIATAVQQGHVVMTNQPLAKAGDAGGGGEQRATAERVAYDGSTEEATLTGRVQVSDTGSVLWADRVVMEQRTGDAVADGAVKANYQESGSSGEMVHLLATRADLKHDAGVADFYGVAGRPARMWQGGSQVEAPVLRLEQKQKRMVARGAGPGAAMAVHAVFVSAGPGAGLVKDQTGTKMGSGKAAGKGDGPKQGGVVRVASREMIYTDEALRADFSGGVLVQSADGTMHAEQATVFLQGVAGDAGGALKPAAASGKGVGPGGFMGGSVDRMLATGRVEIEQPGRRALGSQVEYTASDGSFVMTGVPGSLPKMIDDARGMITGASLRFHAGDNSVVVSNGTDRTTAERVRTEMQVKQ